MHGNISLTLGGLAGWDGMGYFSGVKTFADDCYDMIGRWIEIEPFDRSVFRPQI